MNSPSNVQVSSVLVKPVSADCNLACKYCFYSPKAALYAENGQRRMSDRVLRELVSQLMSLNPERVSFCWQGGEPTLAGLDFFRQAVELQGLLRAPGQIVENSLQTNGVLIDEEWAEFLSLHRFLVGMSLDGPAELHDYYRKDHNGGFSYERVMRGIGWLRRYNVDFNILVLLNDRNIRRPRELYRFFLSQGFRYLQFIPCAERDPETGGVAPYSVTPEQYGRFLCEVFDEWAGKEVPTVYVREFEDLLISYVTGEAASCVFGRDCGKYVVVEKNGDVYPCDFFVEPERLLGNITEHPIEEIVENPEFAKFCAQKRQLAAKCKGCLWLSHCNGGCPKHWVQLRLNHNYFCESYRMLFEHADRRLFELKAYVEQKVTKS